jgi:hypothetical protein
MCRWQLEVYFDLVVPQIAAVAAGDDDCWDVVVGQLGMYSEELLLLLLKWMPENSTVVVVVVVVVVVAVVVVVSQFVVMPIVWRMMLEFAVVGNLF